MFVPSEKTFAVFPVAMVMPVPLAPMMRTLCALPLMTVHSFGKATGTIKSLVAVIVPDETLM